MPTLAHQIEPARCTKKLTVQEVFDGHFPEDYIVEQKRDDCRYLLQIQPNGSKQNYLTSRRVSKVTGEYVEKQDWMPIIRDHAFPTGLADTVIDGGTFDPKQPRCFASDVVRAMKAGTAQYCAFDILMLRGVDVSKRTWRQRRKLLVSVIEEQRLPWLIKTKRVLYDAGQFLQNELEKGGEGIVLKDPEGAYGERWIKAKRKSTYDVVITGYADPVSTIYAAKGWFGALEIAQYVDGKLKSLGQVKNMTDALRAKINANRKKYLGTVIEIEAETRLDSGKFRNPSVKQERPDKNAEDCIFRPEDEA